MVIVTACVLCLPILGTVLTQSPEGWEWLIERDRINWSALAKSIVLTAGCTTMGLLLSTVAGIGSQLRLTSARRWQWLHLSLIPFFFGSAFLAIGWKLLLVDVDSHSIVSWFKGLTIPIYGLYIVTFTAVIGYLFTAYNHSKEAMDLTYFARSSGFSFGEAFKEIFSYQLLPTTIVVTVLGFYFGLSNEFILSYTTAPVAGSESELWMHASHRTWRLASLEQAGSLQIFVALVLAIAMFFASIVVAGVVIVVATAIMRSKFVTTHLQFLAKIGPSIIGMLAAATVAIILLIPFSLLLSEPVSNADLERIPILHLLMPAVLAVTCGIIATVPVVGIALNMEKHQSVFTAIGLLALAAMLFPRLEFSVTITLLTNYFGLSGFGTWFISQVTSTLPLAFLLTLGLLSTVPDKLWTFCRSSDLSIVETSRLVIFPAFRTQFLLLVVLLYTFFLFEQPVNRQFYPDIQSVGAMLSNSVTPRGRAVSLYPSLIVGFIASSLAAVLLWKLMNDRPQTE